MHIIVKGVPTRTLLPEQIRTRFRETLRAGSESNQVTSYAWKSSSRVEVCGYTWQKSSQSSPILGYPWQRWVKSRPTLGQLLTEQAYSGTTLDRAGSEQAYSGTTLDRAGSEMLALLWGNKKATIWSEAHLEFNGFNQNQRGPAERKCWSTYEEKLINMTFTVESCLSSSIESKTCTNGILTIYFFHSWWVFPFAKLLEWSFP